jgi:thiol:disulfide interchange protein DsbD
MCWKKRFGFARFGWTFLIFLSTVFLHPMAVSGAVVTVEVIHSRDRYPAGHSYPILFRIRISSPLYIHGARNAESGIIATELSFSDSPDLKILKIQFPEPEKKVFPYTNQPLEVFSGEIRVRANLAVGEKAPSGGHTMEGRLIYQACSTNACLPPEHAPVHIPVFVVPKDASSERQNQGIFDSAEKISEPAAKTSRWNLDGALWFALAGVFLGGLALNLTPCIYPLIPITISYFGGRKEENRKRIFVHGALYIAGLAVTNSILGVAASMSGSMLGSALQKPIVLLALAGILISLALSFFGFWELRLPPGLMRMASKNVSGYLGTCFMGLTLGVLAAPCVGPFILGLLTFVGRKGDPFLGFLYFFVLSLGLGLPLAVLALFSSTLAKLPVSGKWMIWIRKALGWVLVGMAGYFLKPLVSTALGEAAIFSAVCVAAGLHLGWLEPISRSNRFFLYLSRSLGTMLIGGSILFLWDASGSRTGIDWIPYTPTSVTEAARKKNPLILEFYADWCGPCVSMDKKVFSDPEIVKMSRDLTAVRVDLTQRHSLQNELLERYQVSGVPTIIFINRAGLEEKAMRIESYVSRNEVLKKMKKLIEQP